MQDDLKKILQLCYAEGGEPKMFMQLLQGQKLEVAFEDLRQDIRLQCQIINGIITHTLPIGKEFLKIYDSGVLARYAKDLPFDIHIEYFNFTQKDGSLLVQEAIAKQVAAAIDTNQFAPKYTDLRICYDGYANPKFITVNKKAQDGR